MPTLVVVVIFRPSVNGDACWLLNKESGVRNDGMCVEIWCWTGRWLLAKTGLKKLRGCENSQVFCVVEVSKKLRNFFLRTQLQFKLFAADWPQDGGSSAAKSKSHKPLLRRVGLPEWKNTDSLILAQVKAESAKKSVFSHKKTRFCPKRADLIFAVN